MEGLLIAVIVFQLSRKSYKPPKKPLSEKVESFSVHCPLFDHAQTYLFDHCFMKYFGKTLHFYLRRRLMSYAMNGNQNHCVLRSKRVPESTHQSWKGLCDGLVLKM